MKKLLLASFVVGFLMAPVSFAEEAKTKANTEAKCDCDCKEKKDCHCKHDCKKHKDAHCKACHHEGAADAKDAKKE